MNVLLALTILAHLVLTSHASEPIVKCTRPTSTSTCTLSCNCSCNPDELSLSCTGSEYSCPTKSIVDICTQNCYCVAAPPEPTIKCTPPISTQFCFEECDCSCKGDAEALQCRVDEDRCPGTIVGMCERACECLSEKQRGNEDL
jgi:hypothetical protein